MSSLISCLLQHCTERQQQSVTHDSSNYNHYPLHDDLNNNDNGSSIHDSNNLAVRSMSIHREDGNDMNHHHHLERSGLEALEENGASLPPPSLQQLVLSENHSNIVRNSDSEKGENSEERSTMWSRFIRMFQTPNALHFEGENMFISRSRLLAKQGMIMSESSNTQQHQNGMDDISRKTSDASVDYSASPLRLAQSFNNNSNEKDNIPTIKLDEFVMPGSDLQKAMSEAILKNSADSKIDESEDECVICMEGFSDDNPRMPTLCGCGENKTFFHLPCLLLWTDKNEACPSCREEIAWEEY